MSIESKLISEMLVKTQTPTSETSQNGGMELWRKMVDGEYITIAGPCSLHDQEKDPGQIDDLIALLSGQVDGMRGPHDKPRSRPVHPVTGEQYFNGIGVDAAKPLYAKMRESGLLVATEIMLPKDLDEMADVVSMAWTGSRTQVGQYIRMIGEAAGNNMVPIAVKNPMYDVNGTWLGMLEAAIQGADNNVPVLALLRGTVPTTEADKAKWRNVPNLDIIPVLRKAFGDKLTIIVDPSHMTHRKLNDAQRLEAVVKIVREANDFGANGHMVEVFHPEHASWTDPGVDVNGYLNALVQGKIS